MKTALITGITGQDGAYLAHFLLGKGYRVVGGVRRSSSNNLNLWRLDALGIVSGDVEILGLEMTEWSNIRRVIEIAKPDEIYNLAAQSFVGASFSTPGYTIETNTQGVARILEAIVDVNRNIRFYQASTSEMFGRVTGSPQNEKTPFNPQSPYGIAKLAAHWLVQHYREAYGLFAMCGILFNHESPLRGSEFVTQKIAEGLARIIVKKDTTPLRLGNLNAERDWGFAGDYVKGMWAMLQRDHPSPGSYVLATGEVHTVRDFCDMVALALGERLMWYGDNEQECAALHGSGRKVITINIGLYRPAEVDTLCGDATLARQHLAWTPHTTLPQLAAMMAEAAVKRIENDQEGKG